MYKLIHLIIKYTFFSLLTYSRRSVSERRAREKNANGDNQKKNDVAHRTCLRALAVTWPFVDICADGTDDIGALVAAEISDLLSCDSSMDVRSCALDVMSSLLQDASTKEEHHQPQQESRKGGDATKATVRKSLDVLASMATSFANGGGMDACAHMLCAACIKKEDYSESSSTDNISSTTSSSTSSTTASEVKHWSYRHSPGVEPSLPMGIQELKHLLSTRVLTYRTEVRRMSTSKGGTENGKIETNEWVELRRNTALLTVLLFSPTSRSCQGLVDRCLNVLIACCISCPSRLARTQAIVWPMPLPQYRLLFGNGCLRRIVQVLMSRDVSWKTIRIATELLCLLLEDEHVEITPKLYSTGLFYFCLRSCTKETVNILQNLMNTTHLRQRYPLWQPLPTGSIQSLSDLQQNNTRNTTSTKSAQRRASGRLLSRASVLGTLLPESMLSVLVYGHGSSGGSIINNINNNNTSNDGYRTFSSIFLGDCNDPEVIWTKEMRRHLNQELDEHLLRFRTELNQDPTSYYLYEPIPPITFDELKHESYCHSYFLNNLCNIRRFPKWTVNDPVALLRDVLDSWRAEVDVASKMDKGETMSFQRAAELLGFVPDSTTGVLQINQPALRKAYLQLARTTHPDRNNGEGKEAFADLHLAYKRLGQVVAGRVDVGNNNSSNGNGNGNGNTIVSDHVTMHLLLRAQTLLYRRYPAVLASVKYPMYQTLVEMCGAGRLTDIVPMLAMRTLAHVSMAAKGNVIELLSNRGFELVVSALRASSGPLTGQQHNARSIRVSSMMTTAALLSTQEGRKRMTTCTSMKSTLYEVLHHGAKNSNGKRKRRMHVQGEEGEIGGGEIESEEAMLDAALAAMHHVAVSGDAASRSSLVERGCFYPLLRMALTEDDVDIQMSSSASSAASSSVLPVTLGRPWSGHPLRRCDVATRILLELAGFRRKGCAIETDEEHEYVRTGLKRVLSEPMVRLLARTFANLPSSESVQHTLTQHTERRQKEESLWCGMLLCETVSPLLIWDVNMRESVLRFVDQQTFDLVDEDAEAFSLSEQNKNSSASFSSSSSGLFTRALGPVHGFNHARLEGEPFVGGIYLKPFVYLRHHPIKQCNQGNSSNISEIEEQNLSSNNGTTSLLLLDGLGVTTRHLSTDLVAYIERATTSSAIVQGGLHADARLAAVAAARDHTLGVLYSLRALTTLLSLGKEEDDDVNDGYGSECACQCVALLTHHTTPLFACASGHFMNNAAVIAANNAGSTEENTMQQDLSSAGLYLLKAACGVQAVRNNRRSNNRNHTSATGEIFARCTVDASVLWMLLDPLRRNVKYSQNQSNNSNNSNNSNTELGPILETLEGFVQCSGVASAHLSGLGVTVDLLWIASDHNVTRDHRMSAFRILTSLIAQPSCGSQVRATVLRMIPSRLLHLMLSCGDGNSNGSNNNNTASSTSTNHYNNTYNTQEQKTMPSTTALGALGNRSMKTKESTHSNNSNSSTYDVVYIFDCNHDDAELLWTPKCRSELRQALTSLRAEIVQTTAIQGGYHPNGAWSLPDGYVVQYMDYSLKFVVANVYVEKFLQDTSVVLSDPQTFAIELVRVLTMEPSNQKELRSSVMPVPAVSTQNLSLLIRAFVSLLMQNPELATGEYLSEWKACIA